VSQQIRCSRLHRSGSRDRDPDRFPRPRPGGRAKPRWCARPRADRDREAAPPGSVTVIVSPKPAVHPDGIKSAEPHVYVVAPVGFHNLVVAFELLLFSLWGYQYSVTVVDLLRLEPADSLMSRLYSLSRRTLGITEGTQEDYRWYMDSQHEDHAWVQGRHGDSYGSCPPLERLAYSRPAQP